MTRALADTSDCSRSRESPWTHPLGLRRPPARTGGPLEAFPAMPGALCRKARAARTFRRMAHSAQTERTEDLISLENGLKHPS